MPVSLWACGDSQLPAVIDMRQRSSEKDMSYNGQPGVVLDSEANALSLNDGSPLVISC